MTESDNGVEDKPSEPDEATYRLFVNSVRDYALLMLDPSGRVISWNVGAEVMKGYARHEIIGSHLSRFYPPESIAQGLPERELTLAANEGRFEDEGWRVRKHGSRFWANVVITTLRDETGSLIGFATSKPLRSAVDKHELKVTCTWCSVIGAIFVSSPL